MSDTTIILDQNTTGMALGVLVIKNIGGMDAGVLKIMRQALEGDLREKYGQLTRAELKALHPLDVYAAYYKKFGYTYHVLPQLESVLKGKAIPDGLPPVAAMFMAELKNMLLTAGHDLDKIAEPLHLRRATGNEVMPTLSGREVMTVPEDYMITDREGVISAILRGCDARTAITGTTQNVLYTTYAPEGIDMALVLRHLDDIEAYIRVFNPAAQTLVKEVDGA